MKETAATVVVEKNYPQRRLLVGLFALPVMILTSFLLLAPVLWLGGEEAASSLPVALPLTLAAELAAVAWGVRYGWRNHWKAALLLKPSWRGVGVGAACGLLLMVLLQVLAAALSKAGVDFGSSDTSVGLGSLTGWARVLLLFFLAPVVVPMVEEFLFRGVILHSLWRSSLPKRWQLPVALTVATVLFSLMHFQGASKPGDFVLLAWIAVVGLVNGLLVVRYRSVWAAVACHLFYNGLTVLALAAL